MRLFEPTWSHAAAAPAKGDERARKELAENLGMNLVYENTRLGVMYKNGYYGVWDFFQEAYDKDPMEN